uniref:Large ribosomal subunit protein uL23c n=1 Tax=Halophila beccarii TaxID=180123 RepID=A0A7G7YEH3_9LILI|nr:ribosomal protein L23 [Halophila beccarii]YP_009973457.1 ribosomal protein L23 [Halophila beccarii]QNH92893.1 ribosomal protein L23 [Halophila beccarii]QNH92908.1 ribosomal protein L23 [Halophila beccarii]
MDRIKNVVVTEKSVLLAQNNNQYTSDVESGSTKTEIKHWVELFFGVKVIAMNSHRLPRKGRKMGPRKGRKMGPIMGHTKHSNYKRMIITLQPGDSIPPPFEFEFYFTSYNYREKKRKQYREKKRKQNTE